MNERAREIVEGIVGIGFAFAGCLVSAFLTAAFIVLLLRACR